MAYLQSIFIYNHAQKLVELQAKKMSHLHLIIISGWVVLYRVNVETIIARRPLVLPRLSHKYTVEKQ
jgi:hypothetical protein